MLLRNPLRQRWLLLTSLFATMLCVACGEKSTRAGGEDFPNTFATWGDSVWTRLGTLDTWSNDLTVPKSIPAASDNFAMEELTVTAKSTPHLARVLAQTLSATLLYTDTAQGLLLVAINNLVGSTQVFDTIALPWTGELPPTGIDNSDIVWIRGKKVEALGQVEFYQAQDADGDSILRLAQGCSPFASVGCQWATMQTQRQFINSRQQHEKLLASCGADGDFDTQADNGIAWMENLLLSPEADTLHFVRISPRQANDWIVQRELGDSAWLWWDELRNWTGGTSLRSRLGIVYYPNDTLRNQVFAFWRERTFPQGGRVTIEMDSPKDSQTVFTQGDTLRVTRTAIPTILLQRDTITEIIYLVAGAGFAENAHQLISIQQEIKRPDPNDGRSYFHLEAIPPIMQGENLQNGLVWYAKVKNNDSLWLRGHLRPQDLWAEVGQDTTILDTLVWPR